MFQSINSIKEVQPVHAYLLEEKVTRCGAAISATPVQYRVKYFFDVVNITLIDANVTCPECLEKLDER